MIKVIKFNVNYHIDNIFFINCKKRWSFNRLQPRLSKRQQSLQKTDVFGNRLNYRKNGKTISKHWAENWSNYAGKLPMRNWPATLKLSPTMQMLPVPTVTLYRADSRFASSQWEMSLQSNSVSHWLGANLESALLYLEQFCCRNSINNSEWQKMQLKWKSIYVLTKSIYIESSKIYIKLLSWWIPTNSDQQDLSPPWNVVIGSR